MAAHAAKPTAEVSLLPDTWGQKEFAICSDRLLIALLEVEALKIKSVTDMAILFPTDRMKSVGTFVFVKVHLPVSLNVSTRDKLDVEDAVAKTVGEVIRKFLPAAYVQCKVEWYDDRHGFYSAGPE